LQNPQDRVHSAAPIARRSSCPGGFREQVRNQCPLFVCQSVSHHRNCPPWQKNLWSAPRYHDEKCPIVEDEF
jgi:hypothetical protein